MRLHPAQSPLTYLDSAATTQKPLAVLDAIRTYYLHDNANVHRAAHALADRATTAFENARHKARTFLGAAHSHEIIWTRGTTESINLVAYSYAANQLKPGDEILISVMEHHSNIVPWQLVAQRTGAKIQAIDIDDRGELDQDDFKRKLSSRTKIVAIGHVSNALGTINPIKEMIATAHAAGAVVMIDGAQAAAHLPIDVVDLDCDFYALSGHKMFGPTGIGVLYGKEHCSSAMPPWQGGGEMIETVTIERTTFNRLPYKFEAGTPDIAGAVGLGAAIDYLAGIDRDALARLRIETRRNRTRAPRANRRRADRRRRARSHRALFRSWSTAIIRTTSAHCSISNRSRCVPAITARCR